MFFDNWPSIFVDFSAEDADEAVSVDGVFVAPKDKASVLVAVVVVEIELDAEIPVFMAPLTDHPPPPPPPPPVVEEELEEETVGAYWPYSPTAQSFGAVSCDSLLLQTKSLLLKQLNSILEEYVLRVIAPSTVLLSTSQYLFPPRSIVLIVFVSL